MSILKRKFSLSKSKKPVFIYKYVIIDIVVYKYKYLCKYNKVCLSLKDICP